MRLFKQKLKIYVTTRRVFSLTVDIENSLSVHIPQWADKELVASVLEYPVHSKHTIFAGQRGVMGTSNKIVLQKNKSWNQKIWKCETKKQLTTQPEPSRKLL